MPMLHGESHEGRRVFNRELFNIKKRVKSLVDASNLKFETRLGPNVVKNPLPNHVKPKVNVVIEEKAHRVKITVDKLKTLLRMVWEVLIKTNNFGEANPRRWFEEILQAP